MAIGRIGNKAEALRLPLRRLDTSDANCVFWHFRGAALIQTSRTPHFIPLCDSEEGAHQAEQAFYPPRRSFLPSDSSGRPDSDGRHPTVLKAGSLFDSRAGGRGVRMCGSW